MAGQSRIQTVAGLHPSKTLVDTPNSPSTMAIHKRTAILNIQNYAKGYQDKHTGNHSPWQNPITSGINIQMKNCDKSQQHKRRPKPTTSITTHIAKMLRHATIRQKRIQKTTLRNEAYADVRRERRSHNFNNGGTQESRLRSKMTKRSLNDGGTQESRQTRQAPKLISRQRRNTGIAFTEKSNNGEGTLKANTFQDKIKENRKTRTSR